MKFPRISLTLKIGLTFLIATAVIFSAILSFLYFHNKEAYEALCDMKTQLIFVALIGIVVTLILSHLVSRDVVKPIKNMIEVVNRLEKGEMKVRAQVERKDETGDLARALNKMIKGVHMRNIPVKMLREDITRRKKTELALRESEQKFRGLVENIDDVVFQLSTEGVFQYISPAMEKFYGFSNKDIIGHYIGITTPPEEMGKVLNAIDTILKGEIVERWELNQIDSKGKTICMEVNAAPLKKDGEVIAILGVMRDITERKRAEMELKNAYNRLKETQSHLIQAEKLKVVGTLASGVAHEVKNPLSIIMQGVICLEEEMKPADKKKLFKVIDMVKKAVTRADGIVRGMLDFSRPTPLELKPRQLNDVIQASLKLVSKQLVVQEIKVTMDFFEKLPLVMLDFNQMQQVFINIILNAVHAMQQNGEIVIKTYTKELEKTSEGIGRRDTDLFKLGDAVVVCELKDNGIGIPKEKLDKVFDPFFTTKPPGKGTGLGLSIIRTIVKRHEGIIEIESKEGEGTTLVITLPIGGNIKKEG